MQTITKKQYDDLIKSIYLKIMENPNLDMGDMDEVKEESSTLVDNWMDNNNIVLLNN